MARATAMLKVATVGIITPELNPGMEDDQDGLLQLFETKEQQEKAEDIALGAVVLQNFEGKMFPVEYASGKLLKRGRNLSAIEKECLAVVWAVKKYLRYLYGVELVLQTDHQPLLYINQAKFENSKLMRWAMYLQNFKDQGGGNQGERQCWSRLPQPDCLRIWIV